MMLNPMEIGRILHNIMRVLEVIINFAVVAANFAKKNGRGMFSINLNS
jgi:hypothetical protein